ncbi:MAG TPA: LptF/LptG family permease [Candidatus Acidoferrum sp.]|nr:LptF/LptG family permease [Candidatus Acidoferrum sp.]
MDRYLFRELLTPLAFCLGGFWVFWLSFDAFNSLADFQEAKLRPWDIVEYYAVMTPEFLVMVLPIVLLLALLYTLTNHARHNEITAMRAAGITLWRVCVPYFAMGLAASALLFGLNEWCVPRGGDQAERILNRYVQKPGDAARRSEFRNFGFTNARGHRAWFIAEYHVKTAEMLKPQVDWTSPDGASHRLYADRAIRTNHVWVFFNVAQYSQADTSAPLLPSLQTNLLAMPEFDETPTQIRSEIKISAYQNKRRTRKADIPLADIWDYLHLHPRLPPADASWLFTKLHGRLAAPWTCLVVVLIAIPFGAASGRRNLFVGVAGSIFICFAYFVIQQVGLALGSGGHLPAWLAAWLPNLIFGALGLGLTMRVR